MPLSLHVNTADTLEDLFVATRTDDQILVVSKNFNMANHCDTIFSVFVFSKVFPANPIKAYIIIIIIIIIIIYLSWSWATC